MRAQTTGTVLRGVANFKSNKTYDYQIEPSKLRAVEVHQGSTAGLAFKDATSAVTSESQLTKEFLPPIPAKAMETSVGSDASVIQLWEGRVLTVDEVNETMQVLLSAKIGQVPDHTGEIELQWVAEQDRDLVKPGAVFYLTLYRQLRRGSVKNAQELRFRRRPTWSNHQLQQIQKDTEMILSKMKAKPLAK